MPDLIDDIYQAAVVPGEWGRVLDALAEIADARGTMLFSVGPGEPRWLSSATIAPLIQEFFESPWARNNPRGQRLVTRRDARFLTDFDALTREEIDADAYYQDFLKPRGFGWCVGTAIRAPSDDTIVFTIERSFERGPVESDVTQRLDMLRPHLARAALLASRIGLDRAHAAVDSLDALGLPAAILKSTGRTLVANDRMQRMSVQTQARPGATFGFTDDAGARLFGAFMTRAASDPQAAHSFAIAGRNGEPPFVAHVLPVRGGARDIFVDARWVLYLTPVNRRSGYSQDILQALYDLSPAEARVTSLILAGRTVAAIAAEAGNSEHTVRTQLKSIFAKTGVSSQAELTRLLVNPTQIGAGH